MSIADDDSACLSPEEKAEAAGMAETQALPQQVPPEVQMVLGAEAEELKKAGSIVTAIFVLVRHLYQRFVGFMGTVANEFRLQQASRSLVRLMADNVQLEQITLGEIKAVVDRIEQGLKEPIALSVADKTLLGQVKDALTTQKDLPPETRDLLERINAAFRDGIEMPNDLKRAIEQIEARLPQLATTQAVVPELEKITNQLVTLGQRSRETKLQAGQATRSWLVCVWIGLVALALGLVIGSYFEWKPSGVEGESEAETADPEAKVEAGALEQKVNNLQQVVSNLANEMTKMRERRHLRCPLSARADSGEIDMTKCEMILGLDPEPGHLKCPHDAVRTNGTVDRQQCVDGPRF